MHLREICKDVLKVHFHQQNSVDEFVNASLVFLDKYLLANTKFVLFLVIIYSIKLKWTLCHLIMKQEHNEKLPAAISREKKPLRKTEGEKRRRFRKRREKQMMSGNGDI